jgi:tRNA A-37 threonylcarbamoyl transferase component Bud32
MDELPQEVVKCLQDKNPDIFRDSGSVATKMLKVYSAGASKAEADRQKQAYDIVDQYDGDKDIAKVPTLLACEELTITHQELKERLRDEGVDVSGDKIEIMLMDYIQGEDFAMYMTKKIVANHPELRDLAQALKNGEKVPFSVLQERTAAALHFSRPGGKHEEEHLKMFEMNHVFKENAKLAINYMERNNIVIDPRILDKLKNTLDLFEKNGFKHGDLHERNVMLTFDNQGNVVDVYIIDYGKNSVLTNDDYLERSNDYQIVAFYHSVTMTEEERRSEYNKEHLADLEKTRILLVRRKKDWADIQSEIQTAKTPEDIQDIIDCYVSKITIDSGFYWKIVELILVDIAKTDRSLACDYVAFLQSGSFPQFAKNDTLRLLGMI